MTTRRRLLAAALSGALTALACSPGDRPSGDVLLLLTIDTCRADRLGVGGDPQARTPFLDRVARAGTQFAVAVAPTPLTLPSHATILSGRIPPEHGARDNGLFTVSEGTPLLAETLSRAGWDTAAFVAAFPLAARFGLGRGFDVYGEAPGVRQEGSLSSFAERTAAAVNTELFAWLEERSSKRPLFLWVHYFDPHAPYSPPRNYAKSTGRDPYRGEIAFTDREFGRLARTLGRRFATVRLCVTADHGESLGEHGEESHGVFVYEATTRVPLVFRGDGATSVVRKDPVSVTAIASTLARWGGAPDEFRGPDLLEDGAPNERVYVETLYPRLRHGWSDLRGFRTARWKIIRAPEPEIYDLDSDPNESENLFETLRDRFAETFAELDDPRWELPAAGEATPDPAVEAKLQSLGYASVHRPARDDSALPDPKSRVRIERHLSRATSFLEAGRPTEARAAISLALSIEPDNKEAQMVLARHEAQSGDVERAFGTLERCLDLSPASLNSLVHYEIGRLALDLERWERAEQSFARTIELDPLNADALYNWGLVAYRTDDFAQAVRRWERTLTIDVQHAYALEWIDDARRRAQGSP